MNYLELINGVLEEMGHRQVETFEELSKPDHERIKTIVNRVNNIILESATWQFMLREYEYTLPANADRLELSEDLKIKRVFVDNNELFYTEEFERLLNGRGAAREFSIFNRNLLLKPEPKERKIKIIYTTKKHAIDEYGVEIPIMEAPTDKTLMPEEYARTVLIFGACMQFKSNPQHPKYKYWLDSYTTARAAMRADSELVTPKPPKFELPRWALGFDRY